MTWEGHEINAQMFVSVAGFNVITIVYFSVLE